VSVSETAQLAIVYLPTASLTHYGNNARLHSKAQLKKLVRSIGEHGWTNPLIIDESRVVMCGNCRLAAANAIGIQSVPTIQMSHMSAA
jgi:ParB-like chromosome segregation protein Spo0J